MEMKICCTCKLSKPVTCFSKNKSSKDGLKPYCKECASRKGTAYREANSEAVKQQHRDYYWKSKQGAMERTQKQRIISPSKICSVCGIEKPIDDFYQCGNGGFRAYCKKCANQKAHKNYMMHRDAILTRKKQYDQDHKEKIDNYNREYYRAHSKEIKSRVKRWVKQNPDRAKDNHVFTTQRRRFQTNDFTIAQWIFCKEYFDYQCAYCGKQLKRPTQDHVVSAENGGENTASNVLPSCGKCNSSKGPKMLADWYPEQPFYSQERQDRITAYFELLEHANTERAV